jgi:transposase
MGYRVVVSTPQEPAAKVEKVRIPLEDPDKLTAFLRELLPDASDEVLAMLVGLFTRQNKEISRLGAALGELRRGRSGGASERLGKDQLALFALLAAAQAGEAPTTAAAADPAAPALDASSAAPEKTSTKPPKEKPRRGVLSEKHPKLEVRELVIAAGDRVCPICGADRVCIGHDESEILEFVPPTFYILRLKRERVACPQGCSGVAVAAPVAKPLDGGIPSAGVLADLVEQKWANHLSITAVLSCWARAGVSIPESTAYDWSKAAGKLVQPVADAIRHRAIVLAHVTGADDTTVRILDRYAEKGRVIGHMWGCVGDGLWAGYYATKTWQANEAWKFLKDRRSGWLQGDGYAGYAGIAQATGVKLAGCWAHARRYFIKAKDKGDKRAEVFLALMGELFAIEAVATEEGVSHEVRLHRRLEHSKPILDRLVVAHNAVTADALPSSPLGRALTYLRNQRPHLRRFLEDGRLPLENNAAERILRPIACGRKRWLFIGSYDASYATANLFTVIGTAKLQGVDIRAYLRWLLGELARREWSVTDAGEHLLPEHFAAFQKVGEQVAQG